LANREKFVLRAYWGTLVNGLDNALAMLVEEEALGRSEEEEEAVLEAKVRRNLLWVGGND
jgi:hypothetical protein